MKLITETVDSGLEMLTEKVNGKKNHYIEGVFMTSEKENRNKRIYPKQVMESAVSKYINDQVSKGRAVGELNHPEGPTINLDKVSHKIESLRWEGNNVIGKAKLLDTPMGSIAQKLIEGGVQLGVSTRGMGSMESRGGKNYVGKDFSLAAVDIVQDPSAHDAFVKGLYENVEWIYDDSTKLWVKKENNKYRAINEDVAIKQLKDLLFRL